MGLAKRGKLRTFFKTWVTWKDGKLIHTDNLEEALEILLWEDILAFKLPGKDRYIQNINKNGVAGLGGEIEYFRALPKNGKIAVDIFHNHLSARNEPECSVTCVPQCLEWEYFDYVPDNEIAKLMLLNPDPELAKRGKLRSFFKTWVTWKDGKLIHSDNLEEALEILLWDDILAFKLPGENRYIQNINSNGIAELGEKRKYFRIQPTNGKIAIDILNNHLSARNDREHSVTCVPQCLEWEYFDFIPVNRLQNS